MKIKVKPTFKYGGVAVPIINSKDELVPKQAITVKFPVDDRRALALALTQNFSTLLIGETGTGKTSAVKELAYLRKQPYVRVNMTGFTTPDELVGTKSVRNGETYFEQGIITDAMQRGAILVLDEINATAPDCLFILHGLLDEDRRITLPNGDVVFPHKNFRVFATCNPDYEGTKSMNRAFLDRFPIIIIVDVLAPDKEQELLIERTKIPELLANQLVTIASMARKDYVEQKIMSYISTRSLLHVAQLINLGLKPLTAYQTTIVKKVANKEEQKILTDIFLAVMRMASGTEINLDTPYVTTYREIENYRKRINEMTEQSFKDRDYWASEFDKIREVSAKETSLRMESDRQLSVAQGRIKALEKFIRVKEPDVIVKEYTETPKSIEKKYVNMPLIEKLVK